MGEECDGTIQWMILRHIKVNDEVSWWQKNVWWWFRNGWWCYGQIFIIHQKFSFVTEHKQMKIGFPFSLVWKAQRIENFLPSSFDWIEHDEKFLHWSVNLSLSCSVIIIGKFIEASSRVEIIRLWSHSTQLFVDCLQAFPRKTIICHHAFLISLSHFPFSIHLRVFYVKISLSHSPHFPWFFISQTYNATTGIIRHFVNIHTFTRTCLSTSHFELFQ